MYPSWQMAFLIWGQIRERAEVSWGFEPFHMRQFGIPSPYYKRLRSKPSNNMSSPFSAIENLFQCYSFLGISVRKTENPRFAVLWTAGGTIFDSQSEEDRFRVISETRYLLYQYFFFRVVCDWAVENCTSCNLWDRSRRDDRSFLLSESERKVRLSGDFLAFVLRLFRISRRAASIGRKLEN